MENQSRMNEQLRETLIGIAAASFSIVVVVALMEGGGSAFLDATILLFFAFIAPFLFILGAPWLAIVIALAGFAIYHQYRRIPARFMRYLVGAEVIVWQLLGFWCIANFFVAMR